MIIIVIIWELDRLTRFGNDELFYSFFYNKTKTINYIPVGYHKLDIYIYIYEVAVITLSL